MNKNWLYWTPRILAILAIAFISIFALDSQSFLELIIHLIPTFVLVGILILTWKKPIIGGPIFLAIGLFYFVMTKLKLDPLTYIIIAGPFFIIGALFLREGIKKKQIHLKKK